jgi:hypothetical protein
VYRLQVLLRLILSCIILLERLIRLHTIRFIFHKEVVFIIEAMLLLVDLMFSSSEIMIRTLRDSGLGLWKIFLS